MKVEKRFKRQKFAELTLALVAKHLAIKPPSLYNHFASLQDLRDQLTLVALEKMKTHLQEGLENKKGRERARAFISEYRRFAKEHPLLFEASQFGVRSLNPEIASAALKVVRLAVSSLEAWTIQETQRIHAVRILRSLINGFIELESQGGFQLEEDPNRSFDQLIDFAFAGLKVFEKKA